MADARYDGIAEWYDETSATSEPGLEPGRNDYPWLVALRWAK